MREHESPAFDDSSPELPVDLSGFEKQLFQFRPVASALDREQMMFESGRAAAVAEFDRSQFAAGQSQMRRMLRLWQSAALLMCAMSIGLAASLANRTPKVIVVEKQSPPAMINSTISNPTIEVVPPQQVQHAPSEVERRSIKVDRRSIVNVPGIAPPISTTSPRRTRGWALDESLQLADGLLRTVTSPQEPQNSPQTEPPLTPRSLMGDQAVYTIDRLMKEST